MPRRLAQHLFAAALGLALLSGCAVGPKLKEIHAEPPGPEPGQARIYFYRPLDAFLIARETEVVINDKRIGLAVSGAVFYRDALPGRYRIHTVDDEISVVTSAWRPATSPTSGRRASSAASASGSGPCWSPRRSAGPRPKAWC